MDEKMKDELGELIVSIAKGNVSAIDNIYIIMGKIMLAVAKSRLLNIQDSEDVVHDSLMTIVRKAKKFTYKHNAFAWIYTITKNTAINLYNKRKRRKEQSLEVAYNIVIEFDDTSIIINDIFSKLTEYEKEMIVHRYWGGLSFDEIGKVMRKPKATVAYQIDATIKKIRDIYKKT